MNALTILCLAAVLVAVAWADGYNDKSGYAANTYSGPSNPHASSYGKKPHGGRGYGRGRGRGRGFGHHGNVGHGFGRGRGRKLALFGEEPLTIVDKLFERVKDVHDQVKTYSEQVDALLAQLSIQEKKVKELVLVTIVELKETDAKQIASMDKLDRHLAQLSQDNITLYEHVHSLRELNDDNTYLQHDAQVLFATERKVIVWQEREINTLYKAIDHLKPKLFEVKENRFEVFFDTIQRYTTLLGSIRKRETRRMCEVGEVTLDADELRVEYLYQSWFDIKPLHIAGLSAIYFDLNAREDPAHYGYGHHHNEPESVGVYVNTYSTKTGLIIEAFDWSFGDSSLLSVSVAFQVCAIGPGTDPVKH